MMTSINTAIGNVANFDIHVDPTDSIARIIDINYVDEQNQAEAYKNAFPLEVHNTSSTVRSYKFESSIFPEMSATVAIGAQVKGGAQGTGNNTLVDFNKGLTDRVIPKKTAPNITTSPTDDTEKAKNLKTSMKTIAKYFSNLEKSGGFLGFFESGGFDVNQVSAYAGALRDIIIYYQTTAKDNSNNRSIIPTKFSCEVDGIGGLIIGNIFKIPSDLSPKGYKGESVGIKIGYVITGLAHSVQNNDWVTKIDAQYIIMDESKGLDPATVRAIIADKLAATTEEFEQKGKKDSNKKDSNNEAPSYNPGSNKGNVKNYNKHNSGKQTPNSIVLHCTAGYGSALDTVNFVNQSLSIHYAVDREGNVVQGMDENLIGWHANNKNPGSIGIEIGNISSGFLKDGVVVTDASHVKKKDGTYTPYRPLAKGTGTIMESLGFGWNGREYYEQYPDVQINALETLIRGILKRNPGIKINYTSDPNTIYKNVFGFPGKPEAGKQYFPQKPNGGRGATKDDVGIFTHVICSGSEHGDPPPTYKIINMLQRLLIPAPPPPPPPPPLNHKGVAVLLFNALDRLNTDEDGIYAQLNRLNNQGDWTEVIKAYGTREITAGSNYKSTLRNTLNKELDSDELKKVKEILTKKGITY